MLKILFTKKSLKSLKKLPRNIQIKADNLVYILSINFFDKKLKTKKLNTIYALFSFRITKDYRAIFEFADIKTIKILDIKHRKDIYKKLLK